MELGASTIPGLEEVAEKELTSFGARIIRRESGFLAFDLPQDRVMRLLRASFSILRVLVPVIRGEFSSAGAIALALKKISWENFLNTSMTFRIDAIGTPDFASSRYLTLFVKDIIVDYFTSRQGRRPSIDTRCPDLTLILHMAGKELRLYRDAAGTPLSIRGYRRQALEAPLNEVIAAALPQLMGFEGEGLFIDPMTGSGTIAIEAYWRSQNLKQRPPRPQSYGLARWPDAPAFGWPDAGTASSAAKPGSPDLRIIAADKDQAFLPIAQANAQAAGVSPRKLSWLVEAFEYLHANPEVRESRRWAEEKNLPVFLCMNPPYDQRLTLADAGEFYGSLGDILKNHWKGSRAGIFTANLAAAKSIGLRTSRRVAIKNGPLDCRFLVFELY